MTDDEFELAMEELSSAEDFLEFFRIDYDPKIVQVNRLHILQRFHDYLSETDEMSDSDVSRYVLHARMLERAYLDFVSSNAQTEKVFRVFHMNEPRTASIPLGDLMGQISRAPGV